MEQLKILKKVRWSRKEVKSMFTCRQSLLPIFGSLVKKERKAQKGYEA
jgi:hypothetical protein